MTTLTSEAMPIWPDLRSPEPSTWQRTHDSQLEGRTVRLGLATAFGIGVVAFPGPIQTFVNDGNQWAGSVFQVAYVVYWTGIAVSAGALSLRTLRLDVSAAAAATLRREIVKRSARRTRRSRRAD